MDALVELAMQIIFCLIIAAFLGGIIGYLLGKISKCGDDNEYGIDKKILNGYDGERYDEDIYGTVNDPQASASSQMASAIANIPIDDKERAVGQEIGIRPRAIIMPEDSEIDDLKEISGIGIKIEEVLNELGVYNFKQIAEWSDENIDWIEDYLAFKGRVKKEEWIAQAKLLAAGGHTEFSKMVKSGKKYSENRDNI